MVVTSNVDSQYTQIYFINKCTKKMLVYYHVPSNQIQWKYMYVGELKLDYHNLIITAEIRGLYYGVYTPTSAFLWVYESVLGKS